MAAQHFYVTKTGNDGNDGSSWADGDAWLTIQHAADTANPASGTPITIHIAAGTYTELVEIDTYSGTDDDNRIIYDGDIENDSGDGAARPIVDGGNSRLRGFYIIGKDYISIIDFEIKDTTNFGILSDDGEHINVERCVSHSHSIGGIYFNYSSATNAYCKAINCIVYSTRAGLYSRNCNYSVFYNCVAYNNTVTGDYGGIIITTSTNCTIKNCISHDNEPYQIRIYDDTSKTGLVSDYNDLYRDTGTYVAQWGTTGSYTSLGDWQTASSQDANSQEGDPLYVNEGGDDFHITNNASPCYQNGVDLSGTFTIDYDQDTRVHWDIGADYIASAGYTLEIGSGSFTETGQTVNLLKDSRISISAGSFAESGQTVALLKGFALDIGSGSFIETGSSVTLVQKDGDYIIPRPVETDYVELTKPSTSYTELSKTTTDYEELAKPSTDYTELEKPTTEYEEE